ncbi:hypothetical protein [Streptomyces sp. bgisy091]|uniref:hypothetical protein n=1 Tax=Streptomyces sp. bgisy091 TaxID=3413778 RepID=UPI003D727BA4
MSITAVSTPSGSAPPDADEVFAYASGEIAAAAAELWPAAGVELGEYVPSVTGHVRRLHVDGRPLYREVLTEKTDTMTADA